MCLNLDFPNYLAAIISAPSLPLILRRTAAILLKSLLEKNQDIIEQPLFQFTKSQLALSLQEAQPELAKIIGNVIVTLLRLKGFSAWPDILKLLASLMTSKNPVVVSSAISCLEKICEDINLVYELKHEDFESLIPHLIITARSKELLPDQARGSAIHCLAFSFASMGGTKFEPFLKPLIDLLLELIQDSITRAKTNKSVDKNLCGLSTLLIRDKKEEIMPIYRPLFAFHVKSLGSPEYEVAFAACDFWQVYLRTDWRSEYEEHKWEALGEILPELVPQLLVAMRYSSTDLAGIIRDSATDIKYSENEDMNKGIGEENGNEEEGATLERIFVYYLNRTS